MAHGIKRRRWAVTLPATVGFLALALLVGGLGLWSTQTRLSGAVVATGVIEVETNKQVVQHPEGGVVGTIHVRNGDAVDAGQLLLKFDDTFLTTELTIVENQLFELYVRKVRLIAESTNVSDLVIPEKLRDLTRAHEAVERQLKGQVLLFEARKETQSNEIDQLAEQVSQIESETLGTQAQLTSLRRQLDLIADELADQQSLFRQGLTPISRIKALQREEARLGGDIGRLEAESARLRGQRAGIEIEKLRLASRRQEDAITQLRDLQLQETEIEERRLALKERLSRLEIRAPVAGVIYDSQVFAVHSVVQPGAPMMFVVPQDTPLLIAARVESIHVDQIYRGQDVTLRFPAFNQRQTPELFGQVVNLSADAMTDEATGMRYYRAEILPNLGEIARLENQALLPGMPVETYIRTDDRTPLSYFTKPLTDYFVKSFRES
ncbi:MAG: HlyD family type I secretion periplasmic adaptor subunit [Roseobacter sp.]